MNFKFAVFDMDGTLIDSMQYWDKCERIACSELSSVDLVSGEHSNFIYMSLADTIERAEKLSGKKLSKEDVLTHTYKTMYDIYQNDVINPVDGAVEYLKYLKENGVKIAIATATHFTHCEKCLKELGILPLIDNFICTHDVGKNKFHPDVYYEAMKNIGAVKDETMIFEDAAYAINTIYNNGFRYSIVYEGERTSLVPKAQMDKAEHFIHSYKELIK